MTEIRDAPTPPVAELPALDPTASAAEAPVQKAVLDGTIDADSKPERYSRRRLGTVIALGALALGGGIASAGSQESQGELVGSQVQVFNVIASDNPQAAVDPNINSYLRGVQNYLRTRGEGLRMRIAQDEDGRYSIPLIRLDMTQAQIDAEAGYKEEWQNLETKLDRLGYDAEDKVGLAYIYSTGACAAVTGSLPNPKKIAFGNTHSGCYTGATKEGFSYPSVAATQSVLYTSKIADYVPDPNDTMAYASLKPFWVWYETWLDRNGKYYKVRLMASPFFQHHVVVKTVGNGSVDSSPEPDPCQVDCGEGLLYVGGTKATLTAKPGTGAKFVSWQDCPADVEGMPQTGNSCELSVVQDYAIGAQFGTVTPPKPKEKYTLKARVTNGAKLGSLLFKGKKSDQISYTTTVKGQMVVVELVPDAPNAYIKSEKGCENEQLKRQLAVDSGKCYVRLDGKNFGKVGNVERLSFSFAKKAPPPIK